MMNLIKKKHSIPQFKCIILLLIFVLLIFSQTNDVAGVFPANSPLFTRSKNLYTPETNSEPINLNWNNNTAQEIANYYISKGWKEESSNPWQNINMTFNFDILKDPVGLYFIIENSAPVWTDLSPIGGSSRTYNWNNVSFVKNDGNISILSSSCFVNFAMPYSRDHFRIWQYGNNVIGSATHDNGFESSTISYFQTLVSAYYTLFCGAEVLALITTAFNLGTLTTALAVNFFNLITVPVIHYLMVNPISGSNGGHIIEKYPYGWSTAKIVANDWSENSTHTIEVYRANGMSNNWLLTGLFQKWNYLSYDMGFKNISLTTFSVVQSNTLLLPMITVYILFFNFLLSDVIFVIFLIIKRRIK